MCTAMPCTQQVAAPCQCSHGLSAQLTSLLMVEHKGLFTRGNRTLMNHAPFRLDTPPRDIHPMQALFLE